MFYDIESGKIVTLDQLKVEYTQALTAGIIDDDMTFDGYVKNSLTRHNGTLEIIRK